MSTASYIETVKSMLDSLLENDVFLVDFRVKPTNNIKIYLDSDSGLDIEKCIRINRALYKKIEEAAIFPDGNFSLEVSSPGLDEPLKLHRQYHKNIGRTVEITLNDSTVKLGKLTEVNDETVTVNYVEGKGKKAVEHNVSILFTDIKQTKVQITF